MAAIAPGDFPLGVDITFGSREAKPEAHACTILERAGRPYGDAPAADVEGQRGGDGVAEPVGDWNAQHDARASASIEIIGKQMRRQRREDMLHRAVFIHITGHAKRAQLAHFLGACYRTAENQNRQAPIVELADAADQVDPRRVRQTQVDDEQVELREVGAHASEQLGGAFDGDGAMAGAFEGALEALAYERGVVGNKNGLRTGGAGGHESMDVPRNVSECDLESVSMRCRIYQV